MRRSIPSVLGTASLFAIIVGLSEVVTVEADYKDDIGHTRLTTQLGAQMLSGSGVKVAMVEGGQPTATGELSNKIFDVRSTGLDMTGPAFAHVMDSSRHFFGTTTSIAPSIVNVEVWGANHWRGAGFLNSLSSQAPLVSTINRIANHSYIGDGADYVDAPQRLDWVVERDDFLQVGALGNGPTSNPGPHIAASYNSIVAGLSTADHSRTLTPPFTSGDYTTLNRQRPDIVSPIYATSFATPVISAAASLMVEAGHANLNSGSYTGARTGFTIRHSESSEVVKAALMAGADRRYFNSADGSTLIDYRAISSNQTNHGLDKRYGSGQVNIHNSYNMIASAEQNPNQTVASTGFDYNPAFGGAGGTQSEAYYDFVASWSGQEVAASLVWNMEIDIADVTAGQHATAATLHNLDLILLDITNGVTGAPTVQNSSSTNQNSENLWTTLIGGHTYRLKVSRATTAPAFNWDYGLAWSTKRTLGWKGDGTVWSASSSQAWYRGNSTESFKNGDYIVFSDAGDDSGLAVNIQGSVAPKFIEVNSAKNYSFNNGSITGAPGLFKSGSGTLTINNTSLLLGLTHADGGTIQIQSTTFKQDVLSIQGSGTKLTLAQGSSMVADTKALSLESGGILDLKDNDLIIRPAAASSLPYLDYVEARIVAAQNGVDSNFITKWDGPGLTSSAARAANVAANFDLVGLGAIRNGDLGDFEANNPPYTSFGSALGVGTNDILVKYTYMGDLDLNGLVDFDDYILFERGIAAEIPNHGWISGDINYDGVINFDDATVMDQAFFFQGDPLSGSAVIPVPEPATWLLASVGLVALVAARRRKRSSGEPC